MLVTGTLKEGGSLRPFIAVFDKAGKFVTYVNGSLQTAFPAPSPKVSAEAHGRSAEDEKLKSGDRAIAIASGSLMAGASDGNIYLLCGTDHPRMYAVSPSGEVVREFDVRVPAPGLTATTMATTGDGSLFISFGIVQGASVAPASSDATNALISVINPQTGEVSAVYRLPAQADPFSTAACAVSSNNFRFLGVTADYQHQQVARYAPQ